MPKGKNVPIEDRYRMRELHEREHLSYKAIAERMG